MSGLHGFISQRQHTQPNPRRQVGNDFRVPVPPTKLQHHVQNPSTPQPSHSFVPGHSFTKNNAHQSLTNQLQTSNTYGDGFDTEAEGLDDTTITSSDLKSESQTDNGPVFGTNGIFQKTQNASGLKNNHNLAFGTTHDQAQVDPKFEADEAAIEGDDESYEESGDESGSEEDNEDRQEDISIDTEITKELNSPGFAQYLQQQSSFSKQDAYKKPMGSPSTRNMAMRSAANTNIMSKNPFSPPINNVRPTSVDLNQKLPLERKRQASTTTKQNMSVVVAKTDDRPPRRPSITMSPSMFRRTVQPKDQEALQPRPSMLPAQSFVPKTEDSNDYKGHDKEFNKIDASDQDLRDMMPPPVSRKITAQDDSSEDHFGNGAVPGANQGPVLLSDTFPGSGDDDFSADEKQGKDGESETRSVASEADARSKKRARDLDYSLDQLAGMTFDQLRNEPFHIYPHSADPGLPADIAKGTLAEKLDYLATTRDNKAISTQRKDFLASLPIQEYEECGEIMVERFSQIVLKFKNARQERRKAIMGFEDEIAKREERVRSTLNAFEKDFSRLKRGGEDVVRKKLEI